MKHYHVIASFPGCLPEANDVFKRKADAVRYLVGEAYFYRDSGYKVIGSSKAGYAVSNGLRLTIEICSDICDLLREENEL